MEEKRVEFVLGSTQEECGRLIWKDGIFRFEGDADASAKIFLENLNAQAQPAYQAALERDVKPKLDRAWLIKYLADTLGEILGNRPIGYQYAISIADAILEVGDG